MRKGYRIRWAGNGYCSGKTADHYVLLSLEQWKKPLHTNYLLLLLESFSFAADASCRLD